MKKPNVLHVVATGAAVALAAFLTLSGCGKKADETGAVSGSSTASLSTADESAVSSSEDDTPVTDQDLSLEECFQLGNYKGLKLTRNNYTVTDDMVKQYMTSSAEVEEVTAPGAAVEDGDTVNIAYEGEMNGESFDGGTSTSYDLVIGSDTFIPGFEDGIIGMKKGETKDLQLKFPDDYSQSDYAGKDVTFHVTVNKISRPVTDDSEQAEANARSELENQYATYSERELMGNAWAQVRSNSTTKYIRQKDIDTFKSAIEETLNQQLESDGTTFDDYLSNQGLTQDEYNANLESYAKELAKEEMMIEALEKAENISTDDQEYQDTLQTMADQNNMTVDELKEQVPDMVLKQYVETQRLSGRIVDYAEVTEKTADASEAVQSMN
jgi:trigger factor